MISGPRYDSALAPAIPCSDQASRTCSLCIAPMVAGLPMSSVARSAAACLQECCRTCELDDSFGFGTSTENESAGGGTGSIVPSGALAAGPAAAMQEQRDDRASSGRLVPRVQRRLTDRIVAVLP